MQQAIRQRVSWAVAVLPKEEGAAAEEEESLASLKARPCSRGDVKEVNEWFRAQPRKAPSLEQKVRIGYLLQVSSTDVLAKEYIDDLDLRVLDRDLAKLKAQLHINFFKLKHKRRRRRQPDAADADPGRAEEDGDDARADEDEDEARAEEDGGSTQLVLHSNGQEVLLAPHGSQESLTVGQTRIVETSGRRGMRVFRPVQ